jgi:anti-anti-sigma regulatory factor
MTMRISTSRDAGGEVVLIAGRLDAQGVADLERVVAERSGLLHLDLAGLRSADDAGLEALRGLRARGIALTGVSPYFRLLLGLEQEA